MPSSQVFIGASFTLELVAQTGPGTLRLVYTDDPLATSTVGVHDALNPANYTLTGPGSNTVASIRALGGDPQSFDLLLAAPLIPGAWTLAVANVRTAGAVSLGAPT